MSNKRFAMLLVPAVLLSTSVFATTTPASSTVQPINAVATQQQGFSGPSVGLKTVKAVLDAGMFSDDTPVTLTGHITNSLGDEHYQFTDGTGSITIDIDHDKWFGAQVTPQTKITIQGEIDQEFNHTAIDVNHVRVVG
ncbi:MULTISPECIES: NirD/YgiW/YdeI family stress tolerance protein [Photobacterium]|uniref:NirD/YgiW/YdeI family stress tolerance protein n=1 Tax=Photobacterium piscicola TaxID=1378299 RepID=A0ABU6LL69_9GAMM|nr:MULTISPECIES: NirD/YgiW/YdeI family stress tolerance protein [Photobacterium]MEC6798955.1 NirD/YgiW/YdeI family stress tolerance protein [Photobacterium sp. S4TG1]MEC6900100.1 NirD/YgiW/YdeI family stress tolerance protein [Photobacterium piscicola]